MTPEHMCVSILGRPCAICHPSPQGTAMTGWPGWLANGVSPLVRGALTDDEIERIARRVASLLKETP